jgi:hypothetical protein
MPEIVESVMSEEEKDWIGYTIYYGIYIKLYFLHI